MLHWRYILGHPLAVLPRHAYFCFFFFFGIQDKVGDPFTASRWTLHIQHIFEKHSGNRIGPNLLRSAFVTYLLDGQVSVSDSLARDIASAMRHSVKYVSIQCIFLNVLSSSIKSVVYKKCPSLWVCTSPLHTATASIRQTYLTRPHSSGFELLLEASGKCS